MFSLKTFIFISSHTLLRSRTIHKKIKKILEPVDEQNKLEGNYYNSYKRCILANKLPLAAILLL